MNEFGIREGFHDSIMLGLHLGMRVMCRHRSSFKRTGTPEYERATIIVSLG